MLEKIIFGIILQIARLVDLVYQVIMVLAKGITGDLVLNLFRNDKGEFNFSFNIFSGNPFQQQSELNALWLKILLIMFVLSVVIAVFAIIKTVISNKEEKQTPGKVFGNFVRGWLMYFVFLGLFLGLLFVSSGVVKVVDTAFKDDMYQSLGGNLIKVGEHNKDNNGGLKKEITSIKFSYNHDSEKWETETVYDTRFYVVDKNAVSVLPSDLNDYWNSVQTTYNGIYDFDNRPPTEATSGGASEYVWRYVIVEDEAQLFKKDTGFLYKANEGQLQHDENKFNNLLNFNTAGKKLFFPNENRIKEFMETKQRFYFPSDSDSERIFKEFFSDDPTVLNNLLDKSIEIEVFHDKIDSGKRIPVYYKNNPLSTNSSEQNGFTVLDFVNDTSLVQEFSKKATIKLWYNSTQWKDYHATPQAINRLLRALINEEANEDKYAMVGVLDSSINRSPINTFSDSSNAIFGHGHHGGGFLGVNIKNAWKFTNAPNYQSGKVNAVDYSWIVVLILVIFVLYLLSKNLFSLGVRIVQVFALIFFMLPIAVAKSPADDGKALDEWKNKTLSAIFLSASILIAINIFIFLLSQSYKFSNVIDTFIRNGGTFTIAGNVYQSGGNFLILLLDKTIFIIYVIACIFSITWITKTIDSLLGLNNEDATQIGDKLAKLTGGMVAGGAYLGLKAGGKVGGYVAGGGSRVKTAVQGRKQGLSRSEAMGIAMSNSRKKAFKDEYKKTRLNAQMKAQEDAIKQETKDNIARVEGKKAVKRAYKDDKRSLRRQRLTGKISRAEHKERKQEAKLRKQEATESIDTRKPKGRTPTKGQKAESQARVWDEKNKAVNATENVKPQSKDSGDGKNE